jgi:UDP-N-acetylmuramate dehydrogenase
MNIIKLKKLLDDFGENVKFEYDLKKKNWFNIGGKSKVFYKAESLKELVSFLKRLNNTERIFIIGAGSNTLISDDFFDGVVIKLSDSFNKISLLGDDIIIAGSAVLDKTLSNFAMNHDLSGFEFLSGIPGTVGGGIRMNAGCFGKEFKDILLSVQTIDKEGNVSTISNKNINFGYRNNNLSEDLIFLSASFKGIKDDKNKIKLEMNRIKTEKEKNQPSKIKTSGSTFKNPVTQTDKKVWELIKDSVPLDQSFGDAYISEKHCNFFVNKGNASFEDMKKLINFVSKSVLEKTGISLEKEIKILE